MSFARNDQKSVKKSVFSDISGTPVWQRGGVSRQGARNDRFSGFWSKSVKMVPDPKAGQGKSVILAKKSVKKGLKTVPA